MSPRLPDEVKASVAHNPSGFGKLLQIYPNKGDKNLKSLGGENITEKRNGRIPDI